MSPPVLNQRLPNRETEYAVGATSDGGGYVASDARNSNQRVAVWGWET